VASYNGVSFFEVVSYNRDCDVLMAITTRVWCVYVSVGVCADVSRRFIRTGTCVSRRPVRMRTDVST
jgi:hypothetical protein